MGNKSTLGENLKQFRKANSLTQEMMCSKLGCTLKTYRSWEKGVTHPKSDTLEQLAQILGVDIDRLTGRIGENTHDLQFVCDYTGLSSNAIQAISEIKPGGTPSQFLDLGKDFDLFLCKYAFDLAFRLSQIRRAVENGRAAVEFIKETPVTVENWESIHDFLTDKRKDVSVAVFEFCEFFKDVQNDIYSSSEILDELTKLRLTIHKPKEEKSNEVQA